MNCSHCTGNRFYWTGEFLKNGGDPHIRVEVECWLCKRKYQAAVPWENFQLIEKGKKPRKKNEQDEKEELVPLKELQAFNKSFIENFGKPNSKPKQEG